MLASSNARQTALWLALAASTSAAVLTGRSASRFAVFSSASQHLAALRICDHDV